VATSGAQTAGRLGRVPRGYPHAVRAVAGVSSCDAHRSRGGVRRLKRAATRTRLDLRSTLLPLSPPRGRTLARGSRDGEAKLPRLLVDRGSGAPMLDGHETGRSVLLNLPLELPDLGSSPRLSVIAGLLGGHRFSQMLAALLSAS
jgi:hypothetical protein